MLLLTYWKEEAWRLLTTRILSTTAKKERHSYIKHILSKIYYLKWSKNLFFLSPLPFQCLFPACFSSIFQQHIKKAVWFLHFPFTSMLGRFLSEHWEGTGRVQSPLIKIPTDVKGRFTPAAAALGGKAGAEPGARAGSAQGWGCWRRFLPGLTLAQTP